MMEKTLRQSLFISQGSIVEVLIRPLTMAILAVPVLALAGPPLLRLRRRLRPAVAPAAAPPS
jgi:TctA family transporter